MGGHRMRAFACFALVALTSCETAGTERSSLQSPAPKCDTAVAREDIRRTIETFYAALAKNDHLAVQRDTTPDFYAFEIGKKYSSKQLSDLVAKSHAEGRIINWGLGPMTLQVDCSIASATWENVGSAGSAGKLQPRAWLESAVLRRHDDSWVLAFLHSTPKDPRE